MHKIMRGEITGFSWSIWRPFIAELEFIFVRTKIGIGSAFFSDLTIQCCMLSIEVLALNRDIIGYVRVPIMLMIVHFNIVHYLGWVEVQNTLWSGQLLVRPINFVGCWWHKWSLSWTDTLWFFDIMHLVTLWWWYGRHCFVLMPSVQLFSVSIPITLNIPEGLINSMKVNFL